MSRFSSHNHGALLPLCASWLILDLDGWKTCNSSLSPLRDIPISAKKMGMWTDVVRRKHIDDAIVQCEMAHKKAAKICLKVQT